VYDAAGALALAAAALPAAPCCDEEEEESLREALTLTVCALAGCARPAGGAAEGTTPVLSAPRDTMRKTDGEGVAAPDAGDGTSAAGDGVSGLPLPTQAPLSSP
jgi:hypothetical protein